MTAPDFESNLNDALNVLLEGSPRKSPHRDSSTTEIDELVSVAQRLAVLAPAPALDMVKGRAMFLGEAERVLAQRSQRRWSWQGMMPRPALLAAMATIVLFTGVAFTLLMMSGILEPSRNPAVPILATPVMSPTYTATPTRMARTSTQTIPAPVADDSHVSSLVPQAEPIPSPVRPVDPTLRFHSELVLYKCLRL